jgi:hypothetical protein
MNTSTEAIYPLQLCISSSGIQIERTSSIYWEEKQGVKGIRETSRGLEEKSRGGRRGHSHEVLIHPSSITATVGICTTWLLAPSVC